MTAPTRGTVAARAEGKTARRATTAAFAGAFIEWYDFYLYGTASALIFPAVFFPETTPALALIQSFAAFAVGFLTRPIGAILFGHFGDKIGRKPMLLLTVLLIGIGTFAIGLIPSANQIGIWAAVLLIFFRLVQGVGIGGEFGGGSLAALENAPTGKRGLMGSFHQMGTPAGLLVSTGVFSLVQLLPKEALFDWGWRIPFLLSGVLTLFAFYIRRHLPETKSFTEDAEATRKIPFFALIRENWRGLLIGIGARMADAVTYNVINVFAISYATMYMGLDSSYILTGFIISAAVQMCILPFIGALSDRIGRRPVYIAGIVICAVGALFYFPALQVGNPVLTWAMIILIHAVGTGSMFAIQGAFFAELFGTRMRYTGLGVVYQGSALLGGAPTPAIALGLSLAFGSYWPAVIYLVAICLISIVCVWLAGETSRVDLNQVGRARTAVKASAAALKENA
ncbi:MFS family permease [Microbacterium keratanolyticum]|uniref:Putative proline/betaine transporter n=1 Tax=Microbacterium keratanolyticum TaxID=67574 RepID=A0A9W6M843_9MICO|nr:MFS transporter [Microbacterium keratanolyticum]MBM7469038.1 MFS family permease [Microbacterium keratanolyticum]GLK01117.1 MFS transporter [Microbacterium keratanolyticum]